MPFFKKAGGKIFGCQFNRKEQEAMEHEVRSQLAEWSRKNMMEIDATVSIAAKTANSMNRTTFTPEQQTANDTGKQTTENTTNNFYITGTDPRAIADEVDRKLQRRVERRKAAWA